MKASIKAVLRGRSLDRATADMLRAKEVSFRTGASHRQLQWWAEQGVVTPMIFKHARFYSLEQLAQVKKLVAMRKAGASLMECRALLRRGVRFSFVRIISEPTMFGDVLVIPRP